MLRLGRVSNLPTVWTNALAGAVLTGHVSAIPVVTAASALSLLYIGGMWLNDAFDAEIDKRERPDRPIPSGVAARKTVFFVGFAMLLGGVVLTFALGQGAGICGMALAGTVIVYDWLHKRTALSPVIMGVARFLAYCLGALSVGSVSEQALFGAVGLFAYIVGLTYAAKQEAYDQLGRIWPLTILAVPILIVLWLGWREPVTHVAGLPLIAVVVYALRRLFRRAKGDVPHAVVTMIAGIALYDATLIAAVAPLPLVVLAAGCFVLTLLLQRVAPGT